MILLRTHAQNARAREITSAKAEEETTVLGLHGAISAVILEIDIFYF